MTQNVMKCKYCEYKVARWKGKGKHGEKKLWKHVINRHENDFLKAIGFNGTLEDYIELVEVEEDNASLAFEL